MLILKQGWGHWCSLLLLTGDPPSTHVSLLASQSASILRFSKAGAQKPKKFHCLYQAIDPSLSKLLTAVGMDTQVGPEWVTL